LGVVALEPGDSLSDQLLVSQIWVVIWSTQDRLPDLRLAAVSHSLMMPPSRFRLTELVNLDEALFSGYC